MPEENPFIKSEEDEIFDNPQKWYIRTQWVEAGKTRKNINNAPFLRFLTLTSTEAYDVRLLEKNRLLKTTDTGYDPESVFFCEKDIERYTRIRNKLPGAGSIHEEFERFVWAGKSTIPEYLAEYFPFDLINMDFTKSGFKHEGKPTSITMEAVRKIFLIQRTYRQHFTLLLTLSAIKRSVDREGKRQLDLCLTTNLRDASLNEFRRLFKQKYGETITSHKKFMLLVVPKLIIKYGRDFGFDVSCTKSFTYKGETTRSQMISFIFDCEYVGLPNGYGGVPPGFEKYPERVTQILSKGYKDVNEFLDSNPSLKENCSKNLVSN